ncbi:MAG: class I SAM-dependent methyltransferase [Streptococcaceae bacterium]|jgi:tRNA (adenine22-N1)-methyltransferase|nr:class I SAM-dependent methyltransferase [Streptococcaceae bacterium]
MIRLDKRLQAVADFVPVNALLADIGSDHAKIPVYLLENETIDFAVAGEVASGPFEIARKNSEAFPAIKVRLADGLAAIENEDQVDTIVIAGMGGLLISEILEEGKEKLSQVKHLILQPNNEEAALRNWLAQQKFKIVDEKILESKGKIYEIIVAEPGQQDLSEEEAKFGIYLSASEVFQQKWRRRLAEINKVLRILPDKEKDERKKLMSERAQIEGKLKL